MTKEQAAREWVNRMNAVQTDAVMDMMAQHPWDWSEMTIPQPGDAVRVLNLCSWKGEQEGTVKKIHERERYLLRSFYEIEVALDDGSNAMLGPDEIVAERDSELPMWGTMWQFSNPYDQEWLEEGGLWKMSECGFRVYHIKDRGDFFGIDGAGYDFYKEHWIPLFDARGYEPYRSMGVA